MSCEYDLLHSRVVDSENGCVLALWGAGRPEDDLRIFKYVCPEGQILMNVYVYSEGVRWVETGEYLSDRIRDFECVADEGAFYSLLFSSWNDLDSDGNRTRERTFPVDEHEQRIDALFHDYFTQCGEVPVLVKIQNYRDETGDAR